MGCLLPTLIIIVISCLYIFRSFYTKDVRLYYIPQAEMYIQIVRPPWNQYGYVIFGSDSNLSVSNQVDYLKIKKSDLSNISIYINPHNKYDLYIVKRYNNIIPYSMKYKIHMIDLFDTTFFEHIKFEGTYIYSFVFPYVSVNIDGYLQNVYFSDINDNNLSVIEPIKKYSVLFSF